MRPLEPVCHCEDPEQSRRGRSNLLQTVLSGDRHALRARDDTLCKRFLKSYPLFLLLFFLPLKLFALPPIPQGFVNDFASVLTHDDRTVLEKILTTFEQQTKIEIAVVTLSSLEERPIEDYAVELFSTWGIGKKGSDRGVLFVIVQKERQLRFEIGYGLEGTINDALAGRILDEAVLPRFREGNISEGIVAGTVTLIQTIVQKENIPFDISNISQELTHPRKEAQPLPWYLKVLFFVVAAYIFIRHPWLFLFFFRGGRGGRGFGGGGGFGGFGGGRSGGGGASRKW